MPYLYTPVYGFSKEKPAAGRISKGVYSDGTPYSFVFPVATRMNGRPMWDDIKDHPDEAADFPYTSSFGGSATSKWFRVDSEGDTGIPGLGTVASCVFSFHMNARGPQKCLRVSVDYSCPAEAPTGLRGAYVFFTQWGWRISDYASFLRNYPDRVSNLWADRRGGTAGTGWGIRSQAEPVLGYASSGGVVSLDRLVSGNIPECFYKYTAEVTLVVVSELPGGWVKATVDLI